MHVLVFGNFPWGKRKEIETATKRNILRYCLSMFCNDFMLFKKAKRVQLKGAATKGFGSESVIAVIF